MDVESCVPPGFRFHPTEEELVGYYLTRKVASQKIDIEVIIDVDLYRIEPWDLQDRCKHGHEDQKEWYFFSHKDKKYPTGTRTNRATAAGFWKATGRDKAVLSQNKIIGMRKTLVFYQGRAPNGRKTDWIMHEYRLQTSEMAPPQEEGWVVCRAFRKQNPVPRQSFNTWSPGSFYPSGAGYHAQFSRLQAPAGSCAGPAAPHFLDSYTGVDLHEQFFLRDQQPEIEEAKQPVGLTQLLELPHLDNPSCLSSNLRNTGYCFEPAEIVDAGGADDLNAPRSTDSGGQFIDWKVLDRLLVSQLNESPSCSNTNLPPILLDFEAAGQGKDDAFVPSCSSSL